MATYQPIDGAPVLAFDAEGSLVYAAKVVGHWLARSVPMMHVKTWEAGIGERDLDLTPAEFSEWRRSFVKPEVVN